MVMSWHLRSHAAILVGIPIPPGGPLPAALLSKRPSTWEGLSFGPVELLASYIEGDLLDEDPHPRRSRPPLTYRLRRVEVVVDLPMIVPTAAEIDIRPGSSSPRREREHCLVTLAVQASPRTFAAGLLRSPPAMGGAVGAEVVHRGRVLGSGASSS